MSEIYDILEGDTPLLVSMPHSGTTMPDDVFTLLSPAAKPLPDTDWHIPRLYDFAAEMGATVIEARFSRYVIDLNRPPSGESLYPGQATTGLCPDTLFDGRPLYEDSRAVPAEEVEARKARYWQPYHDRLAAELARIKARHGFAILYDCHSILSCVPRLFEGRLPDLNLGTVKGAGCADGIEDVVADVVARSPFSSVVNGRFVGGYITRHYGAPEQGVHALQMEIVQDSYMDETAGFPWNEAKAARLKPVLRDVFRTLLDFVPSPER